MKNIFQRVFPIFALIILLLFFTQLWKNYNRPYLEYQKEFKNLLLQKGPGKAEIANFEFGVQQRWIEELNRIDRCETCHLGVEDPKFIDAPQPYKTHPDADTHVFEKFGCTVCHGGQGMATSMADAHGPTENWNKAVYHENFLQNSCSLCHGEFIRDQAPVLSEGLSIFYDYGCRGCHKIKGKPRNKVAPPLEDLGNSVKVDWLYRWLRNPKEYLPKTKMPSSILSELESAAVAAFLLQGEKPEAEEINGSYEQGKAIFGFARCVSCHSIEGKGGQIAPDLGKISSKFYPDRLFRTIRNPHELWSDSKMPNYGFSDQEVRDLVTFLSEEYFDIELDEDLAARQIQIVSEGNLAKGSELIEKHGCIGCHTGLKGVKDRGEIGAELTAIGDVHISRLDFGKIEVARQHRTVPNWLYNKMINSRLFKPELKMPDFSFSNSEATTATTYLLSLKGEEVPTSYTLSLGQPASGYAPQGKFGKILSKYRCLVCHKINKKGGEMATDLTQEGSRVKKDWLTKYMQTPYAIRPILEERMPRFKIPDSEIEALYSYFRTTLVDDRVEDLTQTVGRMNLHDPAFIETGKKLYYEKFACNACHQIKFKGGAIAPDLTDAASRLRTEWIAFYLHDPKAFVNRSVEPVYRLTGQEIEALTAFLVNPKEGE